jgi:hypothetical protein
LDRRYFWKVEVEVEVEVKVEDKVEVEKTLERGECGFSIKNFWLWGQKL